jgi:HTH-type transcriptional regulator, sugar sensing transcriptional regulator
MIKPDGALTELGFSDLEAQLYCELLKRAPLTGYRLAQAVGKAAANVYQALAALEQRGAVVVEAGETRSYRPVAPAEMLAALGTRFAARQGAAQAALERLHAPAQSDKIFQLRDAVQALERARQMLERTREILLFDLFPGPFRILRPQLAQLAARGVKVAGVVYSEESCDEFLCVRSQGLTRVPENWPGSQLTLVADAREFLVALFSDDAQELHHGLWTDSLYLSCLQHSGLACEIRLSALALRNEDPLAHLSLLPAMPEGLRAFSFAAAGRPSREDAA